VPLPPLPRIYASGYIMLVILIVLALRCFFLLRCVFCVDLIWFMFADAGVIHRVTVTEKHN